MKNEVENLIPQELILLARFCKAAMLVINARLFTLVGLLMSFSLFGWAAYKMEYSTVIAACAFAVLVFWPLQRMEAKREITSTGE